MADFRHKGFCVILKNRESLEEAVLRLFQWDVSSKLAVE